MDKPTRVYSTSEIVVKWFQPRCSKCGNCHAGLPQVFAPESRPWVDLLKAPASEIREQVLACPTGALELG